MHSPQHAGDELVDAVALLHQRDQRRDATFIVGAGLEMREDQLLESIDLILQCHEIGDCLIPRQLSAGHMGIGCTFDVPFIGVIGCLQTDILFIFEQA